MDAPQNRFAVWQKEKVLLDELRIVKPELFVCEKKQSSSVLRETGIDMTDEVKPKGYIKFLPFDFIVEEIQKDGTVISIEKETGLVTGEPAGTVYADLVKVGISSIEAMDQLAKALSCDKKQLSYAGIKDTVAVTAQKMSFRTIPIASIQALDIPQLFLKNLSHGKGVVAIGELSGNRFTLLIRTQSEYDDELLKQKIDRINTNGLYNYYGPQRFGSPRYISHILGKYLLQGEFENVVRAILTHTSKFEWAFVTQLRTKADHLYGDWGAMKSLFVHLPQTFHSEIDVLDRLIGWDGTGSKWIYALGYAPEQIDFWTKSYASYLANQILYRAERAGKLLPEKIPLLLNTSETPAVMELYGEFLYQDKTTDFRKHLRQIPWIRMGENSYLQTKITPRILGVKKLPEGVAMMFELPKGAYATTLLYDLFDIVEGEEEIELITRNFVDTKKELGVGSFDSIRAWVEQYIEVYPERK